MDEWISVKDRLPEESGEYRLRDKNGNEFDGEFDGEGFGRWHRHFSPGTFSCLAEGWIEQWEAFEDVTHWKPLQDEEVEYWLNEGKGC